MEPLHTSAALALLRSCSHTNSSGLLGQPSKAGGELSPQSTLSAPVDFRMTGPQSTLAGSYSSGLRKVASDPVLQGSSLFQPPYGSISSAAASAAALPTISPTHGSASSPFVGVNNAQIQPLLVSLLAGGTANGHARGASSNSSTSSSGLPTSKNMPNSLYKARRDCPLLDAI